MQVSLQYSTYRTILNVTYNIKWFTDVGNTTGWIHFFLAENSLVYQRKVCFPLRIKLVYPKINRKFCLNKVKKDLLPAIALMKTKILKVSM